MVARSRLTLIFFLGAVIAVITLSIPAQFPTEAQQPTGAVPTVTGTESGPIVTVTYPEQINIRAGPHSVYYPAIGVLPVGATAPALGRTAGGEWIQIVFYGSPDGVGWIYAPLVSLSPGFLPIIEPPPTPTPRTTPTIDPTLAAAFALPGTPTRLPTFTEPAPLATLSFPVIESGSRGIPIGFLIFGLALVGILGAVISFLRAR